MSNKFYFTFTVRPEALNDGLRIRKVVPSTEEEAWRVLERMDAESCQTSSWMQFSGEWSDTQMSLNPCLLAGWMVISGGLKMILKWHKMDNMTKQKGLGNISLVGDLTVAYPTKHVSALQSPILCFLRESATARVWWCWEMRAPAHLQGQGTKHVTSSDWCIATEVVKFHICW